jgi:hypothetical protein
LRRSSIAIKQLASSLTFTLTPRCATSNTRQETFWALALLLHCEYQTPETWPHFDYTAARKAGVFKVILNHVSLEMFHFSVQNTSLHFPPGFFSFSSYELLHFIVTSALGLFIYYIRGEMVYNTHYFVLLD